MQIFVKNRGKNREHTKIELMNLEGGQSKVYVFFEGGSQKFTFVDKGGGRDQKYSKMCVRLLWMPP